MRKKLVTAVYLVILIVALILPFLCLIVQGSPDEAINNPSDFYDLNQAFLQEYHAYTSNNFYCSFGYVEAARELWYFDYNFDIDAISIDEVYVYFEHKSSVYPNDTCEVRLSRNGGASFGDWIDVDVEPLEATYEVNVTDYFEWVDSDFSNENFRVSIQVDIEASGCYHPDAEVGLWENKTKDFDMSVKKISDVKKGDLLLSYNMTTGEYTPNRMLSDANIMKGNFTFYHIVTEYPMGLWDKELFPYDNPKEIGHKDVCVTSEQRMFTLEKGAIRADEVEIGMHLHGLFRQEGRMIIIPVKVTKITTMKGDKAVSLDGTSDIFFTHYLYVKIIKTYRLDWLPVKVIYTSAEVSFLAYALLGLFILIPSIIIVFALRRKRK